MRKIWMRLAAVGLVLGTTFNMAAAADELPIVFVHGDSDTAALWIAPIWRFESNDYPADHLFAVDIPHPQARADVSVAEDNRSSPEDAAKAVAAEVDEALAATGAKKVILIANSRGCQTSRNYVKNFGGAEKVAKMVLTGCVHHGVFVAPGFAEGSEYNGAGKFLKALNATPEVPADIPVTLIRSDKFDLYTQPDARFIGNPGQPTGVTYESQELEGADNHILEGVDHRETAYSPQAFEIMYKAVTGEEPETLDIVKEGDIVLTGKITGFENGAPTNMPLNGARLTVYATDAATGARLAAPVYEKTVGADGVWGDFQAKASQSYEFVIQADGYPLTRIFRSAFPRSFKYLNLRLYPALGEGSAVNIMRPRGYIGPDDKALVNGNPMPDIPSDTPVPHVWKVTIPVDANKQESVKAEFNGERIAALSTVDTKDTVTWIEFTY
ncbi:alpha/beta fold hydrolase [Rhizobium sp. L1K21]|uniref:alpha/beta fold hydrolase n=1 Tax=Rhizobium sp. L1K21 TaxID=2954933 RepID=UPI002093E4A6|nr:alpha/beta fold hydrolase [Rhizobium sp. L1K21]MCO6186191.1 alpha/beta fold hydrolase [Rhizobium sp. L1K21]